MLNNVCVARYNFRFNENNDRSLAYLLSKRKIWSMKLLYTPELNLNYVSQVIWKYLVRRVNDRPFLAAEKATPSRWSATPRISFTIFANSSTANNLNLHASLTPRPCQSSFKGLFIWLPSIWPCTPPTSTSVCWSMSIAFTRWQDIQSRLQWTRGDSPHRLPQSSDNRNYPIPGFWSINRFISCFILFSRLDHSPFNYNRITQICHSEHCSEADDQ